jgi:hypothetical protein
VLLARAELGEPLGEELPRRRIEGGDHRFAHEAALRARGRLVLSQLACQLVTHFPGHEGVAGRKPEPPLEVAQVGLDDPARTEPGALLRVGADLALGAVEEQVGIGMHGLGVAVEPAFDLLSLHGVLRVAARRREGDPGQRAQRVSCRSRR